MESTTKYSLEISNLELDIDKAKTKIAKWNNRLNELIDKKNMLKESILKQSDILSSRDWGCWSNVEWSIETKKILNEVFKLKKFKPRQVPAINATLSEIHAIVGMPTGGGKSLCYQLPALMKPGITVVISPLVSLMEDQVQSLRDKNILAEFVDKTNKALNVLTDVNTQVKLLYVTPEKFNTKPFMENLKTCYEQKRLQRIAIDEVHCCSEWGHDFRPGYKSLGTIVETFPNTPILGLTATFSVTVLNDVKNMLKIPGCLIIKAPWNRPNLKYKVIQKPNEEKECLGILVSLLQNEYKGKIGLIYTRTVKGAENIARHLQDKNVNVAYYHAKMGERTRSDVQKTWYNNGYQAIVATIAFGLGIDKKDVRFVIHYTISKSMDNYYQESGRAGRDDNPADCIILYRMKDIFHPMCFKQKAIDNYYRMIKYCLNVKFCRRQLIAESFGEEWNKTCNKMCDICCIDSNQNELQIEQHCKTLLDILDAAEQEGTKYTANKVLDTWLHIGRKKLRNKESIGIESQLAEDIIAYLLVEGYLTVECSKNNDDKFKPIYIKKNTNLDAFKNPDYKLNMSRRKYIEFKSTDQVDEPLPKRNKLNDSDSNNYNSLCAVDLTSEDDSQ